MYDVIIIGAGVTGSAIARELSRYDLKTLVVEKEEDVCAGTSKANSAIVHAGYDCEPGTLMAKLNARGNELMGPLCKDLDIPFDRVGSFVVCTKDDDPKGLEVLYDRGQKNGIPDLEIITDRERLLAMEPNLSDNVVAALYAPTAGIICPFLLTIAMAENACVNGVEFAFNTKVTEVKPEGDAWRVETDKGTYNTKLVIDAAGVYADVFHNQVSTRKIHITPRKGEYCLLDKSAGKHVKHTIFVLPGKFGKGILVTPTIHGNLLLGPTATDIEDKDGTNTTSSGLGEVLSKAPVAVKDIPTRQVITSFAGLRAHEDHHEFIIGEAEGAPGFIDACGIESPGLTSSPAIGEMVAGIVADKLHPQKKDNFVATRKGIVHLNELSLEERNALIKERPEYGTIVCRCETVSEGEILDAIRRPLGAKSLDGVKRRVRAGMGRCQGGFCTPKVMDLLERELGLTKDQITKSGDGSAFVYGKTKGGA